MRQAFAKERAASCHRCKALSLATLTPRPRLHWHHWFQATARGAEAVRADPEGFARIMWDTWSPQGWYDSVTFDRVARAFANPDWVEVTLHSYGEAEHDLVAAWLTEKIRATASLPLLALYLHGSADGVNPPETAVSAPSKFRGEFRSILLDGVGHFAKREAPVTAAAELVGSSKRPRQGDR